jgi:hypothetical protein
MERGTKELPEGGVRLFSEITKRECMYNETE